MEVYCESIPTGDWEERIAALRGIEKNGLLFKKYAERGTWVAQWVGASAFGSGHGIRVLGSSPTSGSLLRGEPASSSLSACLSAYL